VVVSAPKSVSIAIAAGCGLAAASQSHSILRVVREGHMTAQQAGEKLAAMKAAYDAKSAPPADAPATIADKLADPAFRDAYLAGATQQRTEIANLIAGKVDAAGTAAIVDAALAGSLPTSGLLNSKNGISPQNLISAAQKFREIGVSDGALRELLTGAKTDKATYDKVERLRTELLRDPEWKEKWLKGDEQCRLQAALFAIRDWPLSGRVVEGHTNNVQCHRRPGRRRPPAPRACLEAQVPFRCHVLRGIDWNPKLGHLHLARQFAAAVLEP
jgi:hypothetical protein